MLDSGSLKSEIELRNSSPKMRRGRFSPKNKGEKKKTERKDPGREELPLPACRLACWGYASAGTRSPSPSPSPMVTFPLAVAPRHWPKCPQDHLFVLCACERSCQVPGCQRWHLFSASVGTRSSRKPRTLSKAVFSF